MTILAFTTFVGAADITRALGEWADDQAIAVAARSPAIVNSDITFHGAKFKGFRNHMGDLSRNAAEQCSILFAISLGQRAGQWC